MILVDKDEVIIEGNAIDIAGELVVLIETVRQEVSRQKGEEVSVTELIMGAAYAALQEAGKTE